MNNLKTNINKTKERTEAYIMGDNVYEEKEIELQEYLGNIFGDTILMPYINRSYEKYSHLSDSFIDYAEDSKLEDYDMKYFMEKLNSSNNNENKSIDKLKDQLMRLTEEEMKQVENYMNKYKSLNILISNVINYDSEAYESKTLAVIKAVSSEPEGKLEILNEICKEDISYEEEFNGNVAILLLVFDVLFDNINIKDYYKMKEISDIVCSKINIDAKEEKDYLINSLNRIIILMYLSEHYETLSKNNGLNFINHNISEILERINFDNVEQIINFFNKSNLVSNSIGDNKILKEYVKYIFTSDNKKISIETFNRSIRSILYIADAFKRNKNTLSNNILYSVTFICKNAEKSESNALVIKYLKTYKVIETIISLKICNDPIESMVYINENSINEDNLEEFIKKEKFLQDKKFIYSFEKEIRNNSSFISNYKRIKEASNGEFPDSLVEKLSTLDDNAILFLKGYYQVFRDLNFSEDEIVEIVRRKKTDLKKTDFKIKQLMTTIELETSDFKIYSNEDLRTINKRYKDNLAAKETTKIKIKTIE